jgi:hypothetical protein
MHFKWYIQLYKEEHGTYPKSWDELESISSGKDWAAEPFQLRKRIAFVDKEVNWSNPYWGGLIIAVSRDTFHPENHYQSRWTGKVESRLQDPIRLIFFERKGAMSSHQLPPELAAKMFADAGAELPEPSGLSLYPHEIRARAKRNVRFVFGAITATIILTWIIRLLIRIRKAKAGLL